ncbi:anthranilate phosphoribosyltransferase [Legionella hackeliae]|uniref:Anthranilate phosphoribosyltransferase n=1 Tax=Legionella hackeliae TaxID=449 RepID=A0A0A8UVP0_LEGHA|nr:anthranilate phosphoribosyltransferase [Legionella hackeliae]KTD09551.1 anthranilate phosphoribosyltransferase [Legionella hackeliae]CEK11132.1 Anthranilate phosphoribosyltransferase [Legionella hackeliae]STX47884.1 anthranilate phosphoribosyltransferase [Legionella hackeliae]
MNTNKLFEQLISRENLTTSQMQNFMHACMSGQLSDVQIATFLALMRMKGETVEELTTAATVMMKLAHPIDLGDDLIDIVGTGGDGKNTFNVSTVTSFVVAAAGANVAKHGNRSVSSRSGSADLLLHAGFELQLDDEQLKECMHQCHVSFLFAPHFHQAMQHARPARQQLGIRTLFNLLGPLINPARVKKQVVGVFAKQWLEPIAKVLVNLGSQHALVVNSQDGMDEVSISAVTDVVEYQDGQFKDWSIDPKEHGCYHPTLDKIIVDSPEQSLVLAKKVLRGEPGPARDIVLMNAALALYCATPTLNMSEAIEKAKQAIDSGEAARRFEQLKELTRKASK